MRCTKVVDGQGLKTDEYGYTSLKTRSRNWLGKSRRDVKTPDATSNVLLADVDLKRDVIIRPRGWSRDGLQDVLNLVFLLVI